MQNMNLHLLSMSISKILLMYFYLYYILIDQKLG